MESAAWYFTTNKIWDLCKGSDYNSILAVTKKINGGTHGLQDRLAKFKTYFNILSNP
jgi:putative chitinase